MTEPVDHVDPALVETARTYYTDLPYHSFSHVTDAMEAAHALLERCDRYGVDVDGAVVEAALLFHDASYHKDHEAEEYVTKEAYSAAIARDELACEGYDKPFRSDVAACIHATEPDAAPGTNAAKLVRAADLRNLMQDYTTFRENAEALREEHRVLHAETLPEEEWVAEVTATIEHFLDQEIQLTPEDDGFHERARTNLERFRREHGVSAR